MKTEITYQDIEDSIFDGIDKFQEDVIDLTGVCIDMLIDGYDTLSAKLWNIGIII